MSSRPSFVQTVALSMALASASLAEQSMEPRLPPVETIGGVSLPGVPAAVATSAVNAAASAAQSQAEPSDPASDVKSAETNIELTVLPGTTELVRVSRGYLNRIITPFESPKLLTVNPVEVRKEGSSIYITTTSEKPVGVHILSNDPEDTRSISLTLIPARIPPRTIQLTWEDSVSTPIAPVSAARAKRWEQSASYEEKLLELVELVARGEVPNGYSLSSALDAITCSLTGVTFLAGQRLTGSRFSVFVLRATNASKSTIELLSHAGCNSRGVALVAAWPHAYLEPGASTEVYVAVVNEAFEPQPRGQLRPSLLER
jgi:conjugal transfer pilus assembly protein TraK